MPIHFRNTPVSEPFIFDSIGSQYNQMKMVRPKGYPLYHYIQTESGCGEFEILGERYTLNPGQGILMAPYTRHSYWPITPEWLTCFATFTGTIESSIAKILGNRQLIFIEKEQGARIEALISDVAKKYETMPLDSKTLSIDCYSLLMCFVDGMYTSELTEDPLYKRYLAPVIKEIETNFATGITVQELSSRVYISPQYLSRLFGRFLGCSSYEYLTSYRINKAKEFLLTYPRMEVQEVAHRVGIPDASHFIAMFKKITGMTPQEFRRMH